MNKMYAAMGSLVAGAAVWTGAAIAQADNQNHETVGQHFQFMASNLPPPYATPADAQRSKKAEDPNLGRLQLPPGFTANLFAQGLTDARWLQMTPNGDVLLAEAEETFAEGFQPPHGMAFANGKFYVADALGIYSYPYKAGDTKLTGPRT